MGGPGARSVGAIGEQAASPSTIAASSAAIESRLTERQGMWVIYLEAAGILALVLFLVWWTMKDRK